MVIEDVVAGLVIEVGKIGLWIQAIGLLVVIWIAIMIWNFLINRKRKKMLEEVMKDVERIEGKIDKILKKK